MKIHEPDQELIDYSSDPSDGYSGDDSARAKINKKITGLNGYRKFLIK